MDLECFEKPDPSQKNSRELYRRLSKKSNNLLRGPAIPMRSVLRKAFSAVSTTLLIE
jgi:hypothetical protein